MSVTGLHYRGGRALAILFRTEPIQRILGLLYVSPDRMGLSEITSAVKDVASRRTVINALDRLVAEGYLEKLDADSSRPRYQANRANFLFEELRSIALKTLGGFEPLSDAIAGDDNVVAGAIFGSFAKKTAHAGSDIDLLLVLRDPTDTSVLELTQAVDDAAEQLGRRVNLRSYGAGEFEGKRDRAFLARILAEPLVMLKGRF